MHFMKISFFMIVYILNEIFLSDHWQTGFFVIFRAFNFFYFFNCLSLSQKWNYQLQIMQTISDTMDNIDDG